VKVILSVEPVRFPLTGIGRYAYELAKRLGECDQLSSCRLFSGSRFLSGLPLPSSHSDRSYRVRQVVQKSRLAVEGYRLLSPWLRRRALANSQGYLYHSTNFFLPPFNGPRVATVHDLSAFKWASCHDPAKLNYLQRGLEHTLKVADALITDCEFTRQEVLAFSGWDEHRIHAVPLAAGEEFYPRDPVMLNEVLRCHGLTAGQYTLFVGTIEPRKNIGRLLQAYRLLPDSVRLRWPLVVSGYRGWQSEDLHRQLCQAEREGWVRYLGFLPAADLPMLYAGARLFAFPSLYEGFGLPVLEAMKSGVPVVCSDSSSLPEVAGGAAWLCDPRDIQGLYEGVRQGLEDNVWREMAIARGKDHAATFSWRQCAEQTLSVYRSLA